ncbi:serine/threonine-protein kinase [Vulgatibacter sp.]|uniref:serine/threonine-protein kinase n=1 Tax=Vulgatibacter sp. TaxID=1971226 RepID=UPI00356AA3C2
MDEAPANGGLAGLDPVLLAEALLLSLDRGQLAAVEVRPDASGFQVVGERAGSDLLLDVLPLPLGDALAARLALLAGLDIAREEEQLGRIRTRRAGISHAAEHLISMRRTDAGRSVEVRALVTPSLASAGSGPANRSLATYELRDEIGRGGMGVVYRGEHQVLQKPVAIKVLHHGLVRGAEAATRLIMEARAACRARHPAIVDVSDIGRLPDGRTFLVMELVEAPTLDVVLAAGPLPVARVLRIAAQLAGALVAAAEAGVVHRDIKPGNLFLLPGDRVKVADFGLARIRRDAGDSSSPGGVAGTAWYMAPEQAAGLPADARSDLYALGVVMFEMLTGRVPFDGDAPAAVFAAHRSRAVGAIVGPEGLVPPAVDAIVHRALEKDARDRFATPAAMLAAIEAAASTLGGEGAA